MKILGIDPSLSCTGWSIIEDGKLIECGTIKTKLDKKIDKNEAFVKRLYEISVNITRILQSVNGKGIDYVAIEDCFLGRNVKTLMKLAKVHGIILGAVLERFATERIKVYEPSVIKSAITGIGNASKEQVMKMVKLITKYRGNSDDESDAIAVALTCERDIGK